MKFILSLILIALVSFAACLYLPWWSVAVAAFIVAALIPQKPLASFFAGFTAIFILWLALVIFISNANGNVLAHKISLLVLKIDNLVMLMFVTALIGAFLGGLGALTGSFVRRPQQ